jgi:hypothetical protein
MCLCRFPFFFSSEFSVSFSFPLPTRTASVHTRLASAATAHVKGRLQSLLTPLQWIHFIVPQSRPNPLNPAPFLTLPVGFGFGDRFLVNFVMTYNAAGCACTLLGVVVGVLFTDILSQLLKDGDPEHAYYEGSVVSEYLRR